MSRRNKTSARDGRRLAGSREAWQEYTDQRTLGHTATCCGGSLAV
ncbi:hypothetical protein [Paenibacillus sp. JCM 10914]